MPGAGSQRYSAVFTYLFIFTPVSFICSSFLFISWSPSPFYLFLSYLVFHSYYYYIFFTLLTGHPQSLLPRIRLRVSSFYIIFYLLFTYYCMVFIYNRFVPTIQSLLPRIRLRHLFTTECQET